MWLHMKMLRIPWTAMQANIEVLYGTNAVRKLLNTIQIKKISNSPKFGRHGMASKEEEVECLTNKQRSLHMKTFNYTKNNENYQQNVSYEEMLNGFT